MILQEQQPDVMKKLHKRKRRKHKKKERKPEHLSFNDFENMMRHDSYERHNGAIRQKGWEK